MSDTNLEFSAPPSTVGARQNIPATRRPAPAKVNGHREPPASLEAEEYLLSCCFLDNGETLKKCMASRITVASFHVPANQVIYSSLIGVFTRLKTTAIEIVADDLKTRRQLDEIGGFPYLMHVTGRIPTTAQADYFIEKVRELHTLREIIAKATATVERAYGYSGNIDDFISETEAELGDVFKAARGQSIVEAKPITAYSYPDSQDPNILLGHDDYLGRGGGMLFVSHAGAGKSSWIMDACMMWSLGRAWMGIKCGGNLRTLIVQAEDSDRYIGKIFSSFAHANNLTADELAQLADACQIVRLKGVCGDAFFAELAKLTAKHKPDLCVINPIYLYAEGDISKSECAQRFLTRLDEVNRDERFAYILIHHTGKPQAKGNDGKRAKVEDWESAYMGFGSSYLANWPRCTALLEPVAGETGRYVIKLGKGGLNAGITRQIEQGAGFRHEPVTRINIRHSRERMDVNGKDKPVYYWELDDEPVEGAEDAPKPRGRGIHDCLNFADFRQIFTEHFKGEAKAKPVPVFYQMAQVIKLKPNQKAFNRMMQDALDTGELAKCARGYYVP